MAYSWSVIKFLKRVDFKRIENYTSSHDSITYMGLKIQFKTRSSRFWYQMFLDSYFISFSIVQVWLVSVNLWTRASNSDFLNVQVQVTWMSWFLFFHFLIFQKNLLVKIWCQLSPRSLLVPWKWGNIPHILFSHWNHY